METLVSMIGTYNHEINNPLTIVKWAIESLKDSKEYSDFNVDKALSAIDRIIAIMKKIRALSDGETKQTDYTDSMKIYKVS